VDLLTRAKDLFSQNKYYEALDSYQDILNDKNLNVEDLCFCLNEIIKITNLINDHELTFKFSLKLANINIENKKYNIALNDLLLIDENLIRYDKLEFFRLGYLSAFHAGRISVAKNFSKLYLDSLLQLKNLPLVEKHIAEIRLVGLEKDSISSREIKLNIYKGNIEWFNSFSAALVEEYKAGKSDIYKKLLKSYYLIDGARYWRQCSLWQVFTIIHNLNLIKLKRNSSAIRKYLTNAMYDLILIAPDIDYVYELALDVAINLKKKDYALAILEAANELNLIVSKTKIEKVYSLEDDVAVEKESKLDMGTDLFKNISNELDEIQILEKKIEFLVSENNNSDINELLENLKVLDPDNRLVQETRSRKGYTEEYESSVVNKIDKVEEDLLLEISKFLPRDEEHELNEIENSERAFSKVISLMPTEELLNGAVDMVAAFNTLGMPNVSLQILELLSNESSAEISVKEILNIKYLLIESYLEDKRYYKALNVVEETCESFPLIVNEKKCFYYLRAEILRKLGNIKEAYKYYTYVSQLDGQYRMVKQRLKEIE
jgi:hypothetical protein